tara:strand:+ start:547 stop:1176 length:630 start_codon:yes stop_codon:yes gene_type:complete
MLRIVLVLFLALLLAVAAIRLVFAEPIGAALFKRAVTAGVTRDRLAELPDGRIIAAVPVSHAPVEPAVGYRLDYTGRSVTISGGTVRSEALIALARDTDLLVHKALNGDMVGTIQDGLIKADNPRLAHIMADIPDYHTSPVEAASSATEAGAKALVLTHIVPVLPSRATRPAFLKGTDKAYDGPLILGEDGMDFSFPTDGSKMQRRRFD